VARNRQLFLQWYFSRSKRNFQNWKPWTLCYGLWSGSYCKMPENYFWALNWREI